jgi:hypothetical protein
MSGKNRTEAWDRTLKAADQVKPLAQSTGDAARRTILRSRAWAAPQLERTGHALQDNVAPKMSAMLSSAAKRIDPAKPKSGQWRLPVGIAAALAAVASAAAAVLGGRQARNGRTDVTTPADPAGPADSGPADSGPADSGPADSGPADPTSAEGNGQVGTH